LLKGWIDTFLAAYGFLTGSDADALGREAQFLLAFRTFAIELLDDILRGLQYIPLVQQIITV
jgi:hypothetical protein